MIAYLVKCVSDFMFFSSEKELFSLTDLLKKTPWLTKIHIFPVQNKTLKIWETSKKIFKFFLPQETGASGNNIERESQKPHPKLKI